MAFGESVAAPAPGDVDGAECVDVGANHRVCYRGGEAIAVERPLPSATIPDDARWRCAGSGEQRRCTLLGVRPFACDGEACVQRFPRLPDDGPTECADVDGVVVCRTRSAPAGVVPGPAAIGWICGEAEGARLCVDVAPDRPVEAPTGDCRFEHQPTIHRVCTLGDRARGRLDEGEPCASGLSTFGAGSCLPAALPRAECWTSRDCSDGRECVLTSCVEAR